MPQLMVSILLVVLTVIASSCGGGGDSDPSHTLVSLQVTPANAEGHAQFIAIGTFSDGHNAAVTALWTLNPPFSLTPVTPIPAGVSLSSNGFGQCTGFASNAGIFATAPVDIRIPIANMSMNTKNVSGTAELSCP
jgi:hypothetical protein